MHPAVTPALDWDVLCRVVDNHGDLGVCWRLARRLASLGQRVRLWADDRSSLDWMAPHGAPGVEVRPWRSLHRTEGCGDVVVETFGGDLPEGWLARMAARRPHPVWIDLEYLSAEPYVERSDGLPSPQSHGPGAGLTRWFRYPGFTARTGGLLMEDGLEAERARFDADAWLCGLGIDGAAAGMTVSLFCYEQPALAACLARWRSQATRLLVTPGPAALQVAALMGCGSQPGTSVQQDALVAHFLPWLEQPDFDRLLWASDLNHVRGEDSLVRALWAGRPFVWQAYPQHDGAHQAKVQAFVDWYVEGAPKPLAHGLRRHFADWNRATPGTEPGASLPEEPNRRTWAEHARTRGEALRGWTVSRGDLAAQLYRFALSKR